MSPSGCDENVQFGGEPRRQPLVAISRPRVGGFAWRGRHTPLRPVLTPQQPHHGLGILRKNLRVLRARSSNSATAPPDSGPGSAALPEPEFYPQILPKSRISQSTPALMSVPACRRTGPPPRRPREPALAGAGDSERLPVDREQPLSHMVP